MLLLGLLCAVGVAACILPVLPPPVRLILAIPLGASAVALGATQLLLFGFRAVQGILAASIPRIGPLASAYLLERPIETGATLAVWAAVCGGVVALLSGVYSMATTIDDYWVGLTGDEVVAIFAQDPLRSRDREPIRADTIAAIRTTPGVAEVAEFYLTTVMIDGEEVYLETLAVEPLVLHSGGSPTISRDPERTLEALRRGDLAVSEAFVRHFGLDIGDTVELATTRGSRTFRIGAYAHAYAAGPTGSMFLDVPVFSEWFPTDSAPEVDVWVGGVRQEVLDAIQARSAQPLFFRHGDDYANHTKKVIAKFTGLLLVPVSLIGLVGAISLLNLLFANVIGRRRELALVRAAGGTAANVSALVLANGIVIALLATLSGLVLGLAWTPVVADALGDAMGYGIVARLSPAAVWAVVIAAIPLALLSGLGPALLGSRTGVDQLVARS